MEVIDNVIQAYEAVKLNDVSKGIIALCTLWRLLLLSRSLLPHGKKPSVKVTDRLT